LYKNFVGVGSLGKISILVAPTTNLQKRKKIVSAQLQPPLAHPSRAVALDCCCPRPAKGITTAFIRIHGNGKKLMYNLLLLFVAFTRRRKGILRQIEI
jgi:hypothetical protein